MNTCQGRQKSIYPDFYPILTVIAEYDASYHVDCYIHRGLNHINIKNISVKIDSCWPFIAQPSVLVAYSDKLKTDVTVFIRFLSKQRITSTRITFYAVFPLSSSTVPLGIFFQIYCTAMKSNLTQGHYPCLRSLRPLKGQRTFTTTDFLPP